jgi:hypothetical protein
VLPLRGAELRVGLCPDRLVTSDAVHRVTGEPVDELKKLAAKRKASVVLSNHFVRYALLPWSDMVRSGAEWSAYAQQVFTATYGNGAAAWKVGVCDTGRHKPRVACAVDASLLESLRALPCVASVRPYLMTALNTRRRRLIGKASWFVLHEPGRVVLCLVTDGAWKLIRTRQGGPGWPTGLADLLDREHAANDTAQCEQVLVCGEDEPPATAEAYRITDVTLPRGVDLAKRDRAMVLQ